MLKNKKILITGGAGFLGMHLANFFEKQDAQITLIDIAPFPEHEYSSKTIKINADIRNRKAMEKYLHGQDFVVHAAAALPLWKKEDIFSTNTDGTRNILEAARKNKVKRVVYISSTAVYGVPKKHPIVETDPLVCVGPYGITKIEAEKLCFEAIKKGQNVTIIRPKTFLGTGRLGGFEILFDWIHDGKRIPVIGSGNNRYQLLDVDDLVYALGAIIESKSRNLNDAFNIGAEEFGTVRSDLEELFKHAQSNATLFPTPALPIKLALRTLEMMNLSS